MSDLDDEELRATRKLNGVEWKEDVTDTNVGDIQELIEELTKVRSEQLSKEGLKLFEKINEIIARNKELESALDNSVSKDEIKAKMLDFNKLYDWYVMSIEDTEPIWTEEHIEELLNDFIIIPKELLNKGE